MTTKEINKMINAIYNSIAESRISSHIYRDDDYSKVFELRDIAQTAARSFNEDIRIICERVDDFSTCKRYRMSIEDEYSGEIFGGGCIVASFAGSMENPRDRYDVCATWWRWDD